MKPTRTPTVKSSSSTESTASFSELSLRLTEKLSKQVKKNEGIFFTPPSCVRSIVTLLRSTATDLGVLNRIRHIMEPSCGSGEFITALTNEFPDATITGIEHNAMIYQEISKTLANRERIVLHHADFLTLTCDTTTSQRRVIMFCITV